MSTHMGDGVERALAPSSIATDVLDTLWEGYSSSLVLCHQCDSTYIYHGVTSPSPFWSILGEDAFRLLEGRDANSKFVFLCQPRVPTCYRVWI